MTNLEVVKNVCLWYGIDKYLQHVEFTPNRVGQDMRYSINYDKLKTTGFELQYCRGIHKFQ